MIGRKDSISADKKIDILHDHFKDSFQYIREHEKSRDRKFLYILAILGLLFLSIRYPIYLQNIIQSLKISGGNIDVSKLPLPLIVSSLWTSLMVFLVRYYQSSVHVARQYDYLHGLEETVSKSLKEGDVYTRESRAYLENYPLFNRFIYFYYVYPLPFLIIYLSYYLLSLEGTDPGAFYFWFDFIFGIGVVITASLFLLSHFSKRISVIFRKKNE